MLAICYNAESVDIHETFDFADFAGRFEADWRRIAGESSRATVFQTWEWNAAWWRYYGRGKRWWGLAVTENGAVIGIAALFLPLVPVPGSRIARFVGTGGSDYLDILAAPGREEQVARALAAHLSSHRSRWDWIDLQQVRPGAIAEAFPEVADKSMGLRAVPWQGETCPYVPLAADWESFKRGLGKKLRQNVGYYARALEKQYIVEWRTATEATFEEDMDAFFDLHQRRWNQRWLPGAFAGGQARAFHKQAAHALLKSGMLRLHTLTLDHEIRAALYCFQKDDRCYYYLSGFDPELSKLSIGTTLTAHAIRYAIEQDRATEFDLLRGNEAYKYRWGAQDRFNLRLSLTKGGIASPLLAASGKASLALEHRLKEWMHRKHGGAGSSEAAASSHEKGAS
jgi:CelD/BcsL family acetyltransferase involved in cellulose biosynthesis